MKFANITIDRKVLSDIAIHDEPTFKQIVAKARIALEKKQAA
jgi:ribosomal protein L20